MTIKIVRLTYDKEFVDNTKEDPTVLNPQTDPCIKLTALVIDTATQQPPPPGVVIQWTSTRDAVQYYDMNGNSLDADSNANQTKTDTDGITEVYVTSSEAAYPTISATLTEDDEYGPSYKSVVFCTIQAYPDSTYPAPTLPDDIVEMKDKQEYSTPASVGQASTNDDNDSVVAWMATRDNDKKVVDRYILTTLGMQYSDLYNNGFNVPYQYMQTQDHGDNVIQYLLSEPGGTASASQWGQFRATGVAYAMPDPDRTIDPTYPSVVYLDHRGKPQPTKPYLNDADFYKNSQGNYILNFRIPPWTNALMDNADDIVDVYMYINGFVTGTDAPNSEVVNLGSLRYGDLDSGTFSIRKSMVNIYCMSHDGRDGSLVFTYLVNGSAWSRSRKWTTKFSGSGTRKADTESE